VSCEVYGGKNPCEFANDVALGTASITLMSAQSAWGCALFAQTPRSEPPANAGAVPCPLLLGIGNEAHWAWYLLLENSALAHGPSMYMSSLAARATGSGSH